MISNQTSYLLGIILLMVTWVSFGFDTKGATNYSYYNNDALVSANSLDTYGNAEAKLMKYPLKESDWQSFSTKCNKYSKVCYEFNEPQSVNLYKNESLQLQKAAGFKSPLTIEPNFVGVINSGNQINQNSVTNNLLNSEISIKPSDSTKIKINQNRVNFYFSY